MLAQPLSLSVLMHGVHWLPGVGMLYTGAHATVKKKKAACMISKTDVSILTINPSFVFLI